MAIRIIKMPDIGEGIAEVELVAWHVQVGDSVSEDQNLADVMTDKATVEIPSPVTGTVLALGCTVGQVVAVGAEIVRIEVAESAAGTEPKPAAPPASVSRPAAAAVTPERVPVDQPSSNPPRTQSIPHVPSQASEGHALAAPAVRRRATELGLDLNQLTGSGPEGRITHADLDRAMPSRGAGVRTAGLQALTGEQAVPVIGLRRKIAQKMQDAKRRIPHFSYVEEVDVTELEALRARINAQHGTSRGRLTLLPFLIRALALALRDHPEINARFDDEAGVVTRFEALHLGLATQTDAGLMVPVIRHAEALDPWVCAAEILRLSDAARRGNAGREELSGSTLTVTSLGALGGIASTPVINAPEVAIVGTNRIVERPMFVGGAVVARKLMNLSSSFDHRVVDGMHAAEFIQQVRGYLEHPGLLWLPS